MRRPRPPTPNQAERQQEARLQHVIDMLAAEPDKQRAIMTDGSNADADVIITIAIRGFAAFEMTIPQDKYDAWNLMTLIDRHGGTVPQ